MKPAVGSLLFSFAVLATAHAAEPPGENLAMGKSYTLFPRPTYQHCTDPGDRVQLTDGKTTEGYFWTQPGTVGWQHAQYAAVTVDLGRVEPIGGVAMTTAAGVAGVTWPMAVDVLVSDDGKTFRDAGDLVALDHKQNGPWPEGYAIRRLVTREIRTRGRYVQFVIIPLAGGPYTFTDEIEIFRGPGDLLEREPTGPAVTAAEVYRGGRLRRAVRHRLEMDARAVEVGILYDSGRNGTDPAGLLQRLEEIRSHLDDVSVPNADAFRAVLPLVPAHAEVFRVQADWWRRLGRPELTAWVPPTWDPVPLLETPPEKPSEPIEVHTMRGEYRAAAVNLANAADGPADVRIRLDGLPEAAARCITLHQVEWTDTSQGVAVAAALPEAERAPGGWRVTVLPGLVRQVWLTFHVTDVPAGEYAGRMVLEPPGGAALDVPLRLSVYPFDFPKRPALWLGGWSYTNGDARYGVTLENRPAFLEHMRTHFVSAPWATSSVMRKFRFTGDDPPAIELDTAEFDDWIAQWPGAGRYMVFLSVAHYSGALQSTFGGAEIGSPEFDRRVATWISAWVRHLRAKGIEPGRLGLLIHDEPHEGSDVTALLAWAKAIRQAEPKVLLWEDPTYREPQKAPAGLFDACDVLCPNRPMWLQQRETFDRFYQAQRERGRELQFYSCSGPAKLLDPYSYYRLQAWHAWHVDATGSFFWALGDNSGASSWNEYFTSSGPYTPLFLDRTTVTAGKHMEAVRESVEDYEYLVMLRRAVRQAKAAGGSDEALARAESLVENAAARVLNAEGADGLRWHDPKDRTTADRVRVEILKALRLLE